MHKSCCLLERSDDEHSCDAKPSWAFEMEMVTTAAQTIENRALALIFIVYVRL